MGILKSLNQSGERNLACILIVVLVILLTLQTVLRYVFHYAFTWSEEVLRVAFVWAIYLAACNTAIHDRHIRIITQLRFLKVDIRNAILLFGDIIWVLYSILLGIEGIKLVHSMFLFPYRSPTLGVNMAYPYCIVPILYFLLAFRVIQNMVFQLRTGKRKKEI